VVATVTRSMPDATIIRCMSLDEAYAVTAVRGNGKTVELALWGNGEAQGIVEPLTLPEIPAVVMRAFAVAYPRTIPAAATRRTLRGQAPTFELTFPPGRDHRHATLDAAGTVLGAD